MTDLCGKNPPLDDVNLACGDIVEGEGAHLAKEIDGN